MMEESAGAVGAAAWMSAACGWLTPAVLFVAMNLVIATIAVVSRLMSSPGGGDEDDEAAGERLGLLLRAPSFLAVDRLRSSLSFSSRLGLGVDSDLARQVVQPQPLSGDGSPEPSLQQQQQQPPAAEADQQPEPEHSQREERRGLLLLRAPSFLAVDRLRSSFSFSSRLGVVANDHAQVVQPQPLSGDGALEPSPQQQQPAAEVDQQLEAEHSQREEARVERSRSEAAAVAPDSSRRRAAAEELELDGLGGEEGEAAVVEVEVDARADDFIRRFREQLRLQRLDSILRCRAPPS